MLNLSDNPDFSGRFYSLRAIHPPRSGRIIARWLLLIVVMFICVLFLPWQQNVRGSGQVTSLGPENRPQTIESVIAGRISQWAIREGQFVNKGDTIATLTEVNEKYFDPNLLIRIGEQLNAKEGSRLSKLEKIRALQRQIEALKDGVKVKTTQAQAKLGAEKVRLEYTENQFQRNKKLLDAGNIPLTKFQEIEYKYRSALAEFQNAQSELERLRAEYEDKISKSESELSQTKAELFETEADLVKIRNEATNVSMRNAQYQILAPQSGIVVKAMATGIGQTLRAGDAVCTIMPQTKDMAVEMYVRAMDVPLLSKGRKVRIQFDGWPALQFSGWPSVSVGTFGGKVEVIDVVNSKPGMFRILVVPDSASEPWPQQLRNGSGTKGWVMLEDVPVWYELWRQLNGFPPSLYEQNLDSVLLSGENKPAKSIKP